MSDADVSLYQRDRTELLRAGLAVASLGLFCLIPRLCPGPVRTESSPQGYYAFPKRDMKNTSHLTLTATRPGQDGLTGGRLSVTLKAGKAPQRAPDLALWEPKLTVALSGRNAVVSWPKLTGHSTGRQINYTVLARPRDVVSTESDWLPVSERIRRTRATLDLRRFEDQAIEVAVLAETTASVRGKKVDFGYRTAGSALPLSQPPPSRGKACRVEDGSGMKRAQRPCPLTDGDLEKHVEVLAKGACSVEDDCDAASYRRLCVDLGSRRRVHLVVFRTPFTLRARRTSVELSSGRGRFRTVGTGTAANNIEVRIDPPGSVQLKVDVCWLVSRVGGRTGGRRSEDQRR